MTRRPGTDSIRHGCVERSVPLSKSTVEALETVVTEGVSGTPLAPIRDRESNVSAMRTPTAVLDLEISGKFTELNDIGDFAGALVLFRLHGRPLGWGAAAVSDGRLDRGALVRQLLEQHAWSCALPLAERAVHSGIPPRAIDVGSMLLSQPASVPSGPLVTVAVCSRTPAAQLQPCLDSLIALDDASGRERA